MRIKEMVTEGREDKTILFMRYIRKHVACLEEACCFHDEAVKG
jgi:hypothetical protein